MIDLHRAASGLLGLAYVAGAWREDGGAAAAVVALPVGVLVGLVWHAEAAAGFTGRLGLTPIRRTSPPSLVRGLAWGFLLAPLAALIAGRLQP